jgi:hypothetical protein
VLAALTRGVLAALTCDPLPAFACGDEQDLAEEFDPARPRQMPSEFDLITMGS